ncbi:MAG: protein-ER retention protein [Trichoglossum hirsutum]|nr:MAG: protein-ER retention protein [Trichoglossum hirsutum]
MDLDVGVEPELDPFSLFLPLPYRVAFILVLGVWAWGLNLHYLHLIKIDVPALIHYPPRHPSASSSHHHSTYRLATLLSVPLALSLLFFWTITHRQARLVIQYEVIPQVYLIFLVVSFLLPINQVSRTGRFRFLSILKRVSVGGIAAAKDGKFADILLADVLTSYAKVFGDMFVSACMFFSSRHSSTGKPDRSCGGQYMVPLIISIPSLIRLRQCLIEYLRVRRQDGKHGGEGSGWGGQHLANALKYTSAFPVIILSALQRGYDPNKVGMSEAGLFRLWLFFVFLNSFYSFYWDVAKDWDLSMFDPDQRNNPEHPYGLRKNMWFRSRGIYYGVIVIDLLLRCTWSFKLSPHLDHFNDLEGGIFVMEALEVLRRWIWIFLRIETEWVRNYRRPAPDDILLSDYSGKVESD